MKDTGERHDFNSVIVSETDYYIHLMHLATYNFALKYVKNKRVLDFGCGAGMFCGEMEKLGFNVTGIDSSPAMISLGKQHLKQDIRNSLAKLFESLPGRLFEKPHGGVKCRATPHF